MQPPETSETLFRMGVEFVGAELVVLLSEAEFARCIVSKGSSLASLNIFYCQIIYSNGVGSQVLTTLVSTLPLHSIYTQ